MTQTKKVTPKKGMTFHEKLVDIQVEMKAPKNQTARFGRTSYNYRNAESILEAVKPFLKKHGLGLVVDDEPVHMDGTRYVKVTAVLSDSEIKMTCTSYTEIGNHQQMSLEQAYGTALSYAKKTALGNLLCLDDSELDADSKPGEDKVKVITKKEQKTLSDLVKITETDEKQFFSAFNCESYETFPKQGYAKAFKILSERNDNA